MMPSEILCALMHFWIAYAIAVGTWWWLYSFVSDIMTGLGVGWINAMNPQSKAQSLLAPTLALVKHILFGALMIAALVFLARQYPSHRNWAYGLGLLWNVCNGPVRGVAGLIAIAALWYAGVWRGASNVQHVYEVRPRRDKRGFHLISDALPFGRLWYE